MYCPDCKIEVEQEFGFAIENLDETYNRNPLGCGKYIKAKDVKLIKVLKCPKCGYSETIK
jgi:predicted Zn-ribbon and HTH transcriptional regulator